MQLCLGKSLQYVSACFTCCLLSLAAELIAQDCGGRAHGSEDAGNLSQARCMPCCSFHAPADHLLKPHAALSGLSQQPILCAFGTTHHRAAGDSALPSEPEPARTTARPKRTTVASS